MSAKISGNPLSLITPIAEGYINFNEALATDKSEENFRSSKASLGHFFIHDVRYGGMGEVFLCSFKENEKPILALKTFQKQFFFNPVHRITFLNEAVNWSRLSGLPHIMPVVGMEEIDNRLFITMPCFLNDGQPKTYRDVLDDKSCSFDQKLKLFWQCVLGMKFVNQRFKGLVHGDLKPENLMVVNEEVFVTDFGLSKTIEELKNPQIKINLSSTLAYKAPELWDKQGSPSEKSDVYALGVILYELIMGTRPHKATSAEEWAIAHKSALPAVPKEISGDKKKLLELAITCLNSDAEKRPDHETLFKEFTSIWAQLDPIDNFIALANESQAISNYNLLQKSIKGSIVRGLLKLKRPDLVLEELKDDEEDSLTSELLHTKATSLSLTNRDEEAIVIFQTLLKRKLSKSLEVNCLSELALSLKRTEKFSEAEKIYLDLLTQVKKEELPKIYTNLGTVYLASGNYKKAISCLMEMLKENPDIEQGWGNLGLAYLASNDIDKAITSFNKGLSLNPGQPFIQVQLAAAYLEREEPDKSYALLDSAYNQGYASRFWLENMLITCHWLNREDELNELLHLARVDLEEADFKQIMDKVLERLEKFKNKSTPNDTLNTSAGLKNEAINNNHLPSESDPLPDEISENDIKNSEQQGLAGEPVGFSLPFLNFRYYMDENNFSIDYYDDTANAEKFSKNFKRAFNQAKRDPNMKLKNMQLRTTMLYFTECENCGIEILTNRDEKKALSCRKCDHRFATKVKSNPMLQKLLNKCLKLLEIKTENIKGQSVLIIVQPYPGDDLELIHEFFMDYGYSERKIMNDKLVFYLQENLAKRGHFSREDPVLAYVKDFSQAAVIYEGQTPPEVDKQMGLLRTLYRNLRSGSMMFDPNPNDVAGLMFIGKNPEALSKLEEKLLTKPDDLVLNSIKIQIYMELGRTQEVVKLADHLLKIYPNEAMAWAQMGTIYYKIKETKKAIPFLERAFTMDPLEKHTLISLMYCYKTTGQDEAFHKAMLQLNALGGY